MELEFITHARRMLSYLHCCCCKHHCVIIRIAVMKVRIVGKCSGRLVVAVLAAVVLAWWQR